MQKKFFEIHTFHPNINKKKKNLSVIKKKNKKNFSKNIKQINLRKKIQSNLEINIEKNYHKKYLSKKNEKNLLKRLTEKKIDKKYNNYIKNNYDEKSGQKLFIPKIRKLNKKVFIENQKNKIKSEIDKKSKNIEKKISSVFYFLSLNKNLIRIEKIDYFNLKNDCIILLKNIIIQIIKENRNLNLDDFLDLILEYNFLEEINLAYDFIEDKGKEIKKDKKMKDSDERFYITKNYQKLI